MFSDMSRTCLARCSQARPAYLQAEKAAGRNVVTLVLKNLANSTPHVQLVSSEAAAVANRPHVLVVP